MRIPFVIYENNLLAGKANRYLAPFAKKILVSYKDIEGINDKHKDKIIVIGNILREEILNNSEIDLPRKENCLNILVLGGSQAAKILLKYYLIYLFNVKKIISILKFTNSVLIIKY